MSEIRIPLYSIEAEMSVLGSMILSQNAAEEMRTMLSEDDFFRPAHQTIFRALKQLVDQRKNIDFITLRTILVESGKIADCGGMEYLVEVANYVPSPANARYYADIVVDKSTLRKLENAGRKMIDIVHDTDTDTVKEKIEQATIELAEVQDYHTRGPELATSIKTIFEERDTELACGVMGWNFSTGFKEIDRITGGFFPEMMYTLGAYSAMGKTALMTEMIFQSASKGMPWLLIELEMSKADIINRFIQSRTGLDVIRMKQHGYSGEEYQEIADVMEEWHKMPIYIHDRKITLPQIEVQAKKIIKEHGFIGGIGIDHIGLLANADKSKRKNSSKTERVSECADDLKLMAKDLACSMLVLSQLNRQSQGREKKRPYMIDLKESGDVEAASDVVMLAHRDEYYEAKADNRAENPDQLAHIYVDKNRYGATDTAKVKFNAPRVLWSDLPGMYGR